MKYLQNNLARPSGVHVLYVHVGSIRWRGVLQKYIFRHAVPGNNNYNVFLRLVQGK